MQNLYTKLILFLVAIMMMCASCTWFQQNGAMLTLTGVEVYTLGERYKQVEVIVKSKSNVFSEEDLKLLNDNNAKIKSIIQQLTDITKGKMEAPLIDVIHLWDQTTESYTVIRNVIGKYISGFESSTQTWLTSFDEQAMYTNTHVQKLIDQQEIKDTNNLIMQITSMMSLALKTAALTGVL